MRVVTPEQQPFLSDDDKETLAHSYCTAKLAARRLLESEVTVTRSSVDGYADVDFPPEVELEMRPETELYSGWLMVEVKGFEFQLCNGRIVDGKVRYDVREG